MSGEREAAGPPWPARLATAAVFFVTGAVFGNWVARIPAMQEKLGLSEGALGLALFGIPAGSVVTMPFVGWLAGRLGSRPVTTLAALSVCLSLPLLALAPGLAVLVPALFVFGAANGATDVAMNVQGVAVEGRYRRSIMSSFHAAFSFGGLAGAAVGGLFAGARVGLFQHFALVALALGGVVLVASRYMLPPSADVVADGSPTFARPTRTLAGLSVVAFAVLVGEGAVADWSAVYMEGTLGAAPGLAAAGYAAFSLTMAVGRLAGDQLAALLGPVGLVRAGGWLAAGGLGLGLLAGHPLAAIVGFACAGAGFAAVFPLVLSAAGRGPDVAPGVAIAAMSTVGYFGFLVGPPVIGLLAEATSLPVALGFVVLMSALIAAFAGALHTAPTREVPSAPGVTRV